MKEDIMTSVSIMRNELVVDIRKEQIGMLNPRMKEVQLLEASWAQVSVDRL